MTKGLNNDVDESENEHCTFLTSPSDIDSQGFESCQPSVDVT